MVPRGNQIQYFDEDSASYITVTVKPGTPEYEAIWKPFLHQFSYHLEQMGWLEKTTIAMDEHGMKEMKAEQTWKGWDTAALRNSGYLHRAYNSWHENPFIHVRVFLKNEFKTTCNNSNQSPATG